MITVLKVSVLTDDAGLPQDSTNGRAQDGGAAGPVRKAAARMVDVHVAGPVFDQVQRCTRCHEILKDFRSPGAVGGPYPVGGLVERTPQMQALSLTAAAPTCVVQAAPCS